MFVRVNEREGGGGGGEREREREGWREGGGVERELYLVVLNTCIACTVHVLHHKTVQMSHHYKMTSLIYM